MYPLNWSSGTCHRGINNNVVVVSVVVSVYPLCIPPSSTKVSLIHMHILIKTSGGSDIHDGGCYSYLIDHKVIQCLLWCSSSSIRLCMIGHIHSMHCNQCLRPFDARAIAFSMLEGLLICLYG